MENLRHCDCKFLAWPEIQPVDAGKDSNRVVSLKRPGCYSPPKPLAFFASASYFTEHRHYLFYLKNIDIYNQKNLVWKVAVLHYRQMQSQALCSSREIASNSANFRAIITNIYTCYHCSFPLNGHHSPKHFPSMVFFEPGMHARKASLWSTFVVDSLGAQHFEHCDDAHRCR